MQNATKVTVSTFGLLAGLAGIEHGIGEILQGNVAPEGIVIASWPDSEAFRILAGEPAMTIVPIGIILGLTATRIHTPLPLWRTHYFTGARRLLAAVWPWSFGAGLIAWLLLFPGSILLNQFVGLNNPDLVVSTLILAAFGLLLLTIFTGFAYDVERQAEVRLRPVMSG